MKWWNVLEHIYTIKVQVRLISTNHDLLLCEKIRLQNNVCNIVPSEPAWQIGGNGKGEVGGERKYWYVVLRPLRKGGTILSHKHWLFRMVRLEEGISLYISAPFCVLQTT